MQTLGNDMYIEEECVKLFVFLNDDYQCNDTTILMFWNVDAMM